MGRLDRPRCWRRILGILPCKIKVIGRIYDPDTQQLSPNPIYDCFGKLRMSDEHPRKSLSRLFPCIWFLSIQEERRIDFSLPARHAYDTVGFNAVTLSGWDRVRFSVIALPRLDQRELLTPGRRTVDIQIAKEGCLSPQLFPLDSCQPEVHLLQMVRSVVT